MSSAIPLLTFDAADKAVIFTGYAATAPKADVKLLNYNPPQLTPDFVEIAISHCGICGSDIHTIDSGWGPSNYPVIVGHEIIGTIVAVGSAVSALAIGDRVGVGAQCSSCLDAKKNCPECEAGWQQHCRVGPVFTYNSKYPDGQVSQGGYADRVRANSNFVFKIPDVISSAEAAPLMCAGVTVYAPLARAITRPNMKVAIIGIGGLGHLGVMFAAKLGATVTAVSHNSKKKDQALAMGATDFLDTSDPVQLKAAFRKFDYVLSTANGSAMDLNKWFSTVKFQGEFCTVGAPEEPLSVAAFAMIGAQIKITGSLIGSIDEVAAMLKFAADNDVRPIIEKLPMAQANDGLKKVFAKYPSIKSYTVIELDNRDDGDAIQAYLGQITPGSSVPRVFIAGKFIGGGDDTVAAQANGTLKTKLTAAGAI